VGYLGYSEYTSKRHLELTRARAELTARVWFSATRFRNEPETYLTMRDSLLSENGITREQMQQYLNMYNKEPEKYEQFAQLVNYYIDSLCDLRESYQNNRKKPDSLKNLSISENPKQSAP
jgi:hypothetical protein